MAEMTQPVPLIDRIVAGVMEQLKLPSSSSLTGSTFKTCDGQSVSQNRPNAPIEILDDVVTAASLEDRAIGSGPIVFGAKSVLTPSARDFLAARKIDWTRVKAGDGRPTVGCRWLVVLAQSTPFVSAALEAIAREPSVEWSREIAGCHREAAICAVGALCRGEFDGAIVFTKSPEAVACRANRNPRVRAAAVATVLRVPTLREELGVNLFAVDPAARTAFELRNLLRTIGSAGRPAVPSDWSE